MADTSSSGAVEETWETTATALEGLRVNDEQPAPSDSAPEPSKDSTSPASTSDAIVLSELPASTVDAVCSKQSENGSPAAEPAQISEDSIDPAIKQALGDPSQRMSVLRIEELVLNFLKDTSQDALQFPVNFSSYQRMLAHRVGQYYGLQTSTVDYEECAGRVVAVRTSFSTSTPPKLSTIEVPRATSTSGQAALRDVKPKLLRRAEEDRGVSVSTSEQNQSPSRTMKERQEDYMRAREKLGLGPSTTVEEGTRNGRGGRGGRGTSGGGRADGGRGRKAVFKNKDQDLKDPDYTRGVHRFNGTARFDPNYQAYSSVQGGIYQMPSYSSEFPSLGAGDMHGPMGSGKGHMQGMAAAWGGMSVSAPRPPPPPPPGGKGGSGAHSGSSGNTLSGSASAAGGGPSGVMPATPYGAMAHMQPYGMPYPMPGMYAPPGAYYPGMQPYGYMPADFQGYQGGAYPYTAYPQAQAPMAMGPGVAMRPHLAMAYGYDPQQFAAMHQQMQYAAGVQHQQQHGQTSKPQRGAQASDVDATNGKQ